MSSAIRIRRTGGPEVLEWTAVDVGEPGPGQVRLRHTAIGLNFIDTYHRSGLYPLTLPAGLGCEAAGVVEAAGAGVQEVAAGDRVACLDRNPPDAYSERRLVSAERLVPLPDAVDDESAAALMLKGLTAWYLLHRSYRVHPGDTVLLYAAAGGVGQLVAQWARHLGVRVIGVVGSRDKAALARENGCAEAILATEDIPARVRELTGGAGVAAVYDSVGRDTFMASLDSLRPHGTMVSFGNASGAVEPFSLLELTRRGSLYVTRPNLFDFIPDAASLRHAAATLFAAAAEGTLRVHIGQRYALRDAAQAHRDLEARRTRGQSLLIP